MTTNLQSASTDYVKTIENRARLPFQVGNYMRT